jgi:hypothetical protein
MVAPPSLSSISAPAEQALAPAKPLPPVARSVDVPLKKAVTGINPPHSRRLGLQQPSLKIAPISKSGPDHGSIEGGLTAKAAAAESTPMAALLLSVERPHRPAPSLPPAAPPPTGWPPGMAPEPETPPEGWPEGWPPSAETMELIARPDRATTELQRKDKFGLQGRDVDDMGSANPPSAAPASSVATAAADPAAPATPAAAASAAAATPAPLATALPLPGQAEAATPAPIATAAPPPGQAEAATKVQAAQRGKAARKEQKKDRPKGAVGTLTEPEGAVGTHTEPKGAVGTHTEPKPEAPSSEAASSEAPQLGDIGKE